MEPGVGPDGPCGSPPTQMFCDYVTLHNTVMYKLLNHLCVQPDDLSWSLPIPAIPWLHVANNTATDLFLY